MIWFIGYFVVMMVVWVITARLTAQGDEQEDRVLAVMFAGAIAMLWPVGLLAMAVYFLAFRKSGREDEQR